MADSKWSERKKGHFKGKTKSFSQEEILHKWKENFNNILGDSPEITDKPIQKIINSQLDIRLGPFTEKELDAELKKKKKNFNQKSCIRRIL